MKILVTGFDPFDGENVNPAIEAVKGLPDLVENTTLIKLEIPTVFNKCSEVVEKAIIRYRPDYVLNVGQAGGRACLTPERIAININDGRIPDNAGYQPLGEKIQVDGPAAYFTQLPIKAEVEAIKKVGIPAEVSNSAGTYVCNHIFYQVQYMREKKFNNLKAGFIHIPYLPQQVVNKPGIPSMSLEDIIKGLEAALKAIILYDGKEDVKIVSGKEC